jgi:hypothetical protein
MRRRSSAWSSAFHFFGGKWKMHRVRRRRQISTPPVSTGFGVFALASVLNTSQARCGAHQRASERTRVNDFQACSFNRPPFALVARQIQRAPLVASLAPALVSALAINTAPATCTFVSIADDAPQERSGRAGSSVASESIFFSASALSTSLKVGRSEHASGAIPVARRHCRTGAERRARIRLNRARIGVPPDVYFVTVRLRPQFGGPPARALAA